MDDMPARTAERRLVAAPTLARILDVDPRTIYRWAEAEIIPCVRIQRTVRFDPDEVLAAFERRGPEVDHGGRR